MQVVVIIITCALFGVNLYGTTQLEQYFDQNWVLPPDSMTLKYTNANSEVQCPHFFPVCLFSNGLSVRMCVGNQLVSYTRQMDLARIGQSVNLLCVCF